MRFRGGPKLVAPSTCVRSARGKKVYLGLARGRGLTRGGAGTTLSEAIKGEPRPEKKGTPTESPTDGRTDRRTDRPTDIVTYILASGRLKMPPSKMNALYVVDIRVKLVNIVGRRRVLESPSRRDVFCFISWATYKCRARIPFAVCRAEAGLREPQILFQGYFARRPC